MSRIYSFPGSVKGVWVPIVTPFLNGSIDFKSYRRLLERYLTAGINGVIPLGTTGESATLEAHEAEALVDFTVDIVGSRIPIYVGIGGNSTKKVVQAVKRLGHYPFAGILSVCPYYSRPSEGGILEHFRHIAHSTDRNLIIYNIPCRTGVNLSNDSVFELSEIANIVGIKDCCGSFGQSVDLLSRRPAGFSVMTGEDALFFTLMALEADGGILAAAQYQPEAFVDVYQHMVANDFRGAWAVWSEIEPAVRVMFKESNPMPLKYWLWRQGLISSPECRLPLTQVSSSLARELDLLQTVAPAEVFG